MKKSKIEGSKTKTCHSFDFFDCSVVNPTDFIEPIETPILSASML
jgi:hypothetical protein